MSVAYVITTEGRSWLLWASHSGTNQGYYGMYPCYSGKNATLADTSVDMTASYSMCCLMHIARQEDLNTPHPGAVSTAEYPADGQKRHGASAVTALHES